jgi:nitrite reductase/ring-hydroxylating ferredoxin subunit
LAVFHLTSPDRFVVVQGTCPHAGANLATGELQGNVLTCHWHHWAFDLDTGSCLSAPQVKLRRYECRVEHGDVWAVSTQPIPISDSPRT